MLTLVHEANGDVDIIVLSGILNADTSPKLEAMLGPLSEKAIPRILCHIPDLSYLSSAGVGCFIGVIKRIRSKGGDLRFSQMGPKVRRVFTLLDMDDFFKQFQSVEDGIASFSD